MRPVGLSIIRSGVPRTTLTLEPPWGEMFVGERVSLTCLVEGDSAGWKYLWYKDSQTAPLPQPENSSDTGARYTISAAALHHSGEYWCRAARGAAYFHSDYSTAARLKVSDPPKIILTLLPSRTNIFTGDNVTLRCEVGLSSYSWQYHWYKGNRQSLAPGSGNASGANYTISSAAVSHAGQYWCRAAKQDGSFYLNYSQPVMLVVHERPAAVLTLEEGWTEVFVPEFAILDCRVPGNYTGWNYTWYKDEEAVQVFQQNSSSLNDNRYTISSANESNGGRYTCRGERASIPVYSNTSNVIVLTISKRPQAVLIQGYEWGVFYPAEIAVLECQVKWRDLEWSYRWYKDGLLQTEGSGKDGKLMIHSKESDSGEYTCQGERTSNPFHSTISSPFMLNVSGDLAKAVLTLEPGREAFEGDSVTLRCEVQGRSTRWKYHWYKNQQGNELLQTDSSGTGGIYTISAAALNDGGEYWCRAARGDPEFYSDRPQAVLTLQPQWTQLYIGETLTLRCVVAGEYPGLEYHWFKGSQLTPVPQTADHIVKGSRYTMTAVVLSDRGEYRCLAVRGQPPYPSRLSDSVLVNVSEEQPKAVLTLTPDWTILFPGEKVTLQCLVKGSPRAVLYKQYRAGEEEQGQELQCRSKGTSCTVQKAEESHAGLYWCEDEEGQERSKSVDLKVSNASVILQTPPQPLTEGDKLTLLCRARDTKIDPKRITFEYYKNNETLEFQPSTGVTIPAVMKKDAGLYKCFVYSRGRVLGESEVEVSVRDFFSRVTLTASPGPAVMEGEPVNLTCEVERNTYLSPPVNYTFLRDDVPLAASSGTAQYFITAMNKTHTGRYSCTAETWPGIRKQSAAVKIELASKALHENSRITGVL
ncbi:UNVERIFIED_CONTAM: hypothetical protein FKN15_038539 [Acipenser sinensis]